MPGLFVRRNTTYSRFNFDAPANEDLAFGHAEYQIVADDAYSQDTTTLEHTPQCAARPLGEITCHYGRAHARGSAHYWTERTLRRM